MVEKFYVVISDTMDHNADTFNTFKLKVTGLIKDDLRHINLSHVIFLSDGCGGQYKNWKILVHLMEFFADFGLTAEWIFTGMKLLKLVVLQVIVYHVVLFLATNHGKGPCDRMAAVIKRATRNESLRGAGMVITDAKQMAEFCTNKFDQEK